MAKKTDLVDAAISAAARLHASCELILVSSSISVHAVKIFMDQVQTAWDAAKPLTNWIAAEGVDAGGQSLVEIYIGEHYTFTYSPVAVMASAQAAGAALLSWHLTAVDGLVERRVNTVTGLSELETLDATSEAAFRVHVQGLRDTLAPTAE